MKIKELQKTVNVAWSPAQQYPIMLAAGTAAQQLDNASANSVLEIYSANLIDPGYDLDLKASQPSQFRFQKIIWSPSGFNGPNPNGLLVGGCEGGNLQIYSASKLLNGEESLLARQDKHTGAIRGLDFNPFQHNLLASVASESEIFIWDLNNIATPMAPGTKTQPSEDIQNVGWNKQVQHILASTFSSKCVIWDLRKNEQIIKLSDTQSRVRWSGLQWHPDIATQLWLASEDDQAPYLQLWDLRYATAPAKTIQVHNRGILGLTWCPKDTDLMISCGKDNKIYCWNPNSPLPEGEILAEVATTIQWYSDVQWCPRNPALIASSSLDGNVSIYSVYGGSQQQVQTSNKIADSFPGMDQFAQAPVPQPSTQIHYPDLKKAPKWMKIPTRVSFGFGGRLISFNQKNTRLININQIITEPELIERSTLLEKVLSEGNFIDYCRQKADQMSDQHSRFLWYFLKANFEQDPKREMLNLLGYNKEDLQNKFKKYIKDEDLQNHNTVEHVSNKMATLMHSDSSEVEGDQSTDDSTDISAGDNNSLFDTIPAENKISNETHEKKLAKYKIPIGEDNDAMICQALLTGNMEAAVELCISNGKPAEALIIASILGSEFLCRLQSRYLNNNETELSNVISALISRNWMDVVTRCTIDSWKEALAAALTHNTDQIPLLCGTLGKRLQEECINDIELAKNSLLCYICAGDLEKLVDGWLTLQNNGKDANAKLNTKELLELVEIVMFLKKSLELRGEIIEPSGKLAEFLSQYASLLASQGALETAFSYLGPSIDENLNELRERLYYALGLKRQTTSSQQPQQPNNMYGRQSLPHIQQSTTGRYGGQRTFSQSSQGSVNTFNAGLPGQPIMTPASQPWNTNPALQSQIPPISSVPLVPPQVAAATKPPLGPPPSVNESLNHPQRPSSVGSQQGNNSLPRSKYVLDPSVNTASTYGQTSAYSTQAFNPAGGYNAYNPQQQSFNTTPFSQVSAPTSTSNMYQPNAPLQGVPPTVVPSQNNFKPFTPNITPGTVTGMLSNTGSYLSGVAPIETAQQAFPPPPPPAKNPTPPPGWNDPPVLKSTRQQVHLCNNQMREMSAKHAGLRNWEKIVGGQKMSSDASKRDEYNKKGNSIFQQQPKVDTAPMAPITHPIFGVDANQNQNGLPDPNSYSNPNQYSSGQQQVNVMTPMAGGYNQPPPPPSMSGSQTEQYDNRGQQQQMMINQMNFNNSNYKQTYPTENPVQSKVEPPPPKEKPPLPEEFIYMQTVFEELKNQCMNIAPDPRTKRKFTDVSKRLESLYDALRDRKLVQNTISSLNDIVQYIQVADYQNALATHTAIVSGPDFAQTASFMPGIKVLIQSASELKVYLR